MSRSTQKVAVLMGGFSKEREVSLASGEACLKAIEHLGYQVLPVDVGHDLGAVLLEEKPDIAFNALHGRFGEDGTVQGLLELMTIPYTHSGVLASALAMDKQKSKIAYQSVNLPVAKSILASKVDIQARNLMDAPYVIKPNNEGSSVGVYLVEEGMSHPPALSEEMPEELMVEKYLKGRELTVTVMGDRALCVTEILTEGWYDYEAKYELGGSDHILPANLPKDITNACLDFALKAHNVLGCKGVSRTDFRFDEEAGLEGLYLLETNTQPGMTSTSLAPEQAQYVGISFEEFLEWMIKDAS